MKSRAESLDASLDQLRASFESITQLAASLGAGDPALRAAQSAAVAASQPRTGPADAAGEPSAATVVFDPLVHLPPIVGLPNRLRACLTDVSDGKRGRAEADQLWGAWVEPLRCAVSALPVLIAQDLGGRGRSWRQRHRCRVPRSAGARPAAARVVALSGQVAHKSVYVPRVELRCSEGHNSSSRRRRRANGRGRVLKVARFSAVLARRKTWQATERRYRFETRASLRLSNAVHTPAFRRVRAVRSGFPRRHVQVRGLCLLSVSLLCAPPGPSRRPTSRAGP